MFQAVLIAAALFVVTIMVLRLPREAATIKALDVELGLADMCDCGDEEACAQLEAASEGLKKQVAAATDKAEGFCLYVTRGDVAVRTRAGHVSDVMQRAEGLLA